MALRDTQDVLITEQADSTGYLRDTQDVLITEQSDSAGHLRDTQDVLIFELPIPAKKQIIGGCFQDGLGRRLAYGLLHMELSVESAAAGYQILSGIVLSVPLDGEGNIAGKVYVWPNDLIIPVGTTYKINVFAADGTPAWLKPHYQTIPSIPAIYDIGNWVPSL